jgi:hypothetical protein
MGVGGEDEGLVLGAGLSSCFGSDSMNVLDTRICGFGAEVVPLTLYCDKDGYMLKDSS